MINITYLVFSWLILADINYTEKIFEEIICKARLCSATDNIKYMNHFGIDLTEYKAVQIWLNYIDLS